MNEDNVVFEVSVGKTGGSMRITVPPEIAKFLGGLEDGDRVEIAADSGKHGKYAAFWKKKKE